MEVIMPQMGETVLEGTVASWYKGVGDSVQADEPLFDVETEKVTTEIPAPVSGVLTRVLVEVGRTVKVGTVLAVIEEAQGASALTAAAARASAVPVAEAVLAHAGPGARSGAPLSRAALPGARLSPVVRRLLSEHGIAPAAVKGTGNQGRITREDVLAFVASNGPAGGPKAPGAATAPVRRAEGTPAASGQAPATALAAGSTDTTVVPLNKIRRQTAEHMVRSKATSPHTLQAVEVDFFAVDKVRAAVGAQWKAREGYTLTYLPFIARAVCEAISRFPYVNSSFADGALLVHRRVHLGIAVDLNFEGLIAAIIRDAHHRNLLGMAAEIHRLSAAARAGQLKPDEANGGTYTISNSGTFGTFFSAAIINQPQAAILSTDGVRKRPVVIESDAGDLIAIRPVGVLAQSFDHRAFDGAYSAAYLRCLKETIETRDWSRELS